MIIGTFDLPACFPVCSLFVSLAVDFFVYLFVHRFVYLFCCVCFCFCFTVHPIVYCLSLVDVFAGCSVLFQSSVLEGAGLGI